MKRPILSNANHPFEPVYDGNSRYLILGSFPSVLSRSYGFYYMNPHNRFYAVIENLYHEKCPENISGKKNFLLSKGLAVFDVVKSCSLKGSEDSSISSPVPNDIPYLMEKAPIKKILCNGKTAYNLLLRFYPELKACAVCLPSTSPANAAWSLEDLCSAYRKELNVL